MSASNSSIATVGSVSLVAQSGFAILLMLLLLLSGCGSTDSQPTPTKVVSVPTATAVPAATPAQPTATTNQPKPTISAPTPTTGVATATQATQRLPTATKQADKNPLELVFEVKGTTIGPLQGVALDAAGNVFVVQNRVGSDPRIYKFDSAGKLLTSWGSAGAGAGEFAFPAYAIGGGGIAIDAEGNVYATDAGNARVQKFDNNGKFLAQWGSRGEADGQFVDPFGIAVSKQGIVYVSELTRNVVQKFDTNGTFLGKWSETAPGNDQPQTPGWLATDNEGNVYVPLAVQQAIWKYDPDGKLLAEFGKKPVNGRSTGFYGVAVDQAGNVYGTDMDFSRIIKYDKAGAFVGTWDKTTAKLSTFSAPAGIAVDAEGNIYVAEYSGRRLQKLRQP